MTRHTLRHPGRSGLVTGLALLIALVMAVPAFAAGQFGSTPPLNPFEGLDRGSGPIKVSVTEPAWPLAPVFSDQVTIDFSIAGIPEPALLSPRKNSYGNWDFGRNETAIGLLGPNKAPLDANKTDGYPENERDRALSAYFAEDATLAEEALSINWYFGLRTVFISPFTLPYLIDENEKVSLEGPCDLPFIIGTVVDWGDGSPKTTFTSVVPNVPGPVTCSPQGDHVYKQDGDYRVKMSGYDGNGGAWAQHFQVTVLPDAPNLTQLLAPVLTDLSSVAGKLTLKRSDSTWLVQDLTTATPDGRVWAKPLYASYLPNFRPLWDGETFYLVVLVQSVAEDCLAYGSDTYPDLNGYEASCGFYHVTVPITIPEAPGPSLTPATSASPVRATTDQFTLIFMFLLILGVPLLGIGILLASFRRRLR